MDVILMAGLWLPATIWSDVVTELESLGHRATAVQLPGADDRSPDATLDDQLAAALAAVDAADRPWVVGHSAASTLAWLVADRRPTEVAGVAMVGGFPSSSGSAYAEFFPIVDGVMAFPGWEPFEGPDSADLDDAARAAIESVAVPVAGGVASATVELTDERRFSVPVVLVCPEYSPVDAQAWIDGGSIPELARAEHVSLVDIDSGHWPMVSCPAALARIIGDVARG